MILERIRTDRLVLIPVTLEIVNDLMEGKTAELEKAGLKVGSKWPTEDTFDILPFVKRDLEVYQRPTGFEMWLIVKSESMDIIGDIGFKGQPDENFEVEIGYGLAENERGKGYGYETLKAMVNWALNHDRVGFVVAECLIENHASARILEKAGFRETHRDEELIYWKISRK